VGDHIGIATNLTNGAARILSRPVHEILGFSRKVVEIDAIIGKGLGNMGELAPQIAHLAVKR
jgi:hypothetical protein